MQFGGNAQTITRDRWVHHTSFLWDFLPANMGYLTVRRGAVFCDVCDEVLCSDWQ